MAEEVKVRVVQENQGTALKDAKRDAEALQQAQAKSSLAVPPPNLNAPQPPTRQEASAARRETTVRNRQLITDAEEDLARAKAGGASGARVSELEGQVRERKLVARFMREQNLGEDEAIDKARTMVGLQAQAKAHKEATVNATKAATAAESQAAKEGVAALKQKAAEDKAAKAAAVADAKELSKHQKEQAAVEKASESYRTRIARAGGGALDRVAGGSPLGGLAGAVGGGGMIGTIVAAVAAATVGLVASFARQRDESTMIGLEDRTARGVQNRRFQRMAGFEGTASGARQEAESLRDDLTKRNLERAQIQKESEFKWYNPAGWLDHLTGASENKATRNENEMKLDQEGIDKAREIQKKKFAEEGSLEIDIQKKRAAGDMQGARAIEDKLTKHREYLRILNETKGLPGSEQIAQEGASAKLANTLRERAGHFAGLVTARDGATDTARVATFAAEQRRQSEVAAGIHGLTQTVKMSSRDAADAAFHAKFSRPSRP